MSESNETKLRAARPSGDQLRAIARSVATGASDPVSPEEYVQAGWKSALALPSIGTSGDQAPSDAAEDSYGIKRFNLDANIDGMEVFCEFVLAKDFERVVHDLETICDRAGLVRENAQLKDANEGLQIMYRKAADHRDRSLATLERAAAAESSLRRLVDECGNNSSAGWEERMALCIDEANKILAAPQLVERKAQSVSETDDEDFVTSLVRILETQQGDPEDDRYVDGRAEALRIWERIRAVMPASLAQSVSDNGAVGYEACPSPVCASRKVTPFAWVGNKWHRRCEACAQEWDEGGWLSAIECASLEHGKSEAVADLQARIWKAGCDAFGTDCMESIPDRVGHFFEESIEVAQAAGMTREEAHMRVIHTYGRPVGELPKEIGSVVATLGALAQACGIDMFAMAEADVAHISQPHIRDGMRARYAGKPRYDAYRAAPAAEAAVVAVPAGFKLVPLEFLQGFGILAHNWSMEAIPPDFYDGRAGDAFKSAFRECGQALGKLRAMLAAAPDVAAIGEGDSRDGARWRAFVNCARIRMFGWAGAGLTEDDKRKPGDNYVHFGGEFWSVYADDFKMKPEQRTEYIRVLTEFADAALAQQAAPAGGEQP